ncbi:phage integrase central domain-containing protein, partial [Escherichia coli]
TYASTVFGKLPVADVDTTLVLKVLEPIWASETETATRVRGRIESVLDWARTRGYREGENPARWKGHLSNLLAKRSKVAK